MPLQRRLPKFGFINVNRREFAEVQVGDSEGLQGLVDRLRCVQLDDQSRDGSHRRQGPPSSPIAK